MVELNVGEDHGTVCNKKLSELKLPGDTVLVAVIRGDKVIVPKGSTVIETGDRLFAVTSIEQERELRRLLQGV